MALAFGAQLLHLALLLGGELGLGQRGIDGLHLARAAVGEGEGAREGEGGEQC